MKTVRDFKVFVEREAGGVFPSINRHVDVQVAFWEKLNRLGARNLDVCPPEKYPDIDATVELSDSEWHNLTVEFRAIMAM